MKYLNKFELINMLETHKFDTSSHWFYNQFEKRYNLNCVIGDISEYDFTLKLMQFLNDNSIEKIIFFPEPGYSPIEQDILSAIVDQKYLKFFLHENVDSSTNCHVSDIEFRWIFTFTHEDDYLISGSEDVVNTFLNYFDKDNIF